MARTSCATIQYRMDKTSMIMKKLSLILSLSLPLGLMAQGPTGPVGPASPCPNPPCAPGSATTTWEGSIPTLNVRCQNTSIFSCFVLRTPTGPVTPDKMVENLTGELNVLDANGKVVGDKPTVKFTSKKINNADGKAEFNFTKVRD